MQMWKEIKEDWQIKLLAVLLALLIWYISKP